MRVGVTGTRHGMSDLQKKSLANFLRVNATKMTEFHHGDCVGVDDEVTKEVWDWRVLNGNPRVVCHPPIDESLRAFNLCHDEVLSPLTHFARNRAIVDACDLLLVIPMQMEHQARGGTWYTHDYGVKKGKRVVIIWPDGTSSEGTES